MKSQHSLFSLVVPVFNEGTGLENFHTSLTNVMEKTAHGYYELIYCDDGSLDDTVQQVNKLHIANQHVKLIRLSRNFGKESALLAGITIAKGNAIIMLDGDGQHPVELIPQFIEAWKNGAQVVVGVRKSNDKEGWLKRWGSRFFYNLFNKMTNEKLIPGSSDFRLIDREVQEAFLMLRESDRITRGLIDWLGFQREYINFTAKPRENGLPGYGPRKLVKLAIHSFVSLTSLPLYLFGYLGFLITVTALLLGVSIFIEQLLLNDPWRWNFTGTAMLSILLMFLIGIVLLSQGILALYVASIQSQSKHRPLFVVDYQNSIGLDRNTDAKQ